MCKEIAVDVMNAPNVVVRDDEGLIYGKPFNRLK